MRIADMQFESKVVLVVNAHRDIGRAVAAKFSLRGENICIANPIGDRGELYEIQNEPNLIVIPSQDLSNPLVIPSIFNHIERKVGPVDVLINGIFVPQLPSVFDITPFVFDHCVTEKVRTALLMITEYIQRYVDREAHWGRIINLFFCSIQEGKNLYHKGLLDSPVKGAIDEASRMVAREVESLGITINTVSVCTEDTPIRETNSIYPCNSETYQQYMRATANAVVSLVMEESNSINGQTITIKFS
jgi:NAD(P)-dependent dehydrogenase (short-subunit alcohol dehydrogenase family)